MVLEHRPLEILHGVGLVIEVRYFLELAADRIALLRQPTVCVPVGEERAADRLAGLREGPAAGLGRRWLDQALREGGAEQPQAEGDQQRERACWQWFAPLVW